MTHYTNTNNPIDFPKKKEIPMLEKFAAQSLVEYEGELIFSKEKFAELIVRECISMADKESERYSNLDQEYCSMAMDNYRELVRKHFGVEE
jgi:hypothetical protein